MNIWIVEKNKKTIAAYREILISHNDLKFFESLGAFEKAAANLQPNQRTHRPEFIISDLHIKNNSVLDVIQKMRPKIGQVPFLIVSDTKEPDQIRKCFSAGAIDFLSKPLRMAEAKVKLERLLDDKKSVKNGITLSKESLTVEREGIAHIQLTSKEFQIFCILNNANGRKVPRDLIRQQVWKTVSVSSKVFDVHLFNLRKKLWSLNIEVQYTPDGYQIVSKADKD